MSITVRPLPLNISEIIERISPKRYVADLFGLASGYRAYLVYVHFAAMGDDQLAAAGVKRKDIPQIAASLIL